MVNNQATIFNESSDMIERVSELPFWGPEEQIRKFVNQHDQPDENGDLPGGKTQLTLMQERISNLDDIFQKQLIWSYGRGVGDAYFWWDWCPSGTGQDGDPVWRISTWSEFPYNLGRQTNDRSFKYTEFKGVSNVTSTRDEMPGEYDANEDGHAENSIDLDDPTTLDIETLRHNIMLSFLEVSEWLGD